LFYIFSVITDQQGNVELYIVHTGTTTVTFVWGANTRL